MGRLLLALTVLFAPLSLIAFGGANTTVPEMHRQVVETHHWMSDAEFVDLFAIARASPGPNVLLVTLIGWRVAGLAGALVATLAMCLPACALTYAAVRLWDRFRTARWRSVVQSALVALTAGLVAASALVLTRAADQHALAFVLTLATAATALATKLHPLWAFAAAAALGAVFLR